MVRLVAALMLLCAGCVSAGSSTAEVSTDEFAPPSRYRLELPAIERLTITESGMGSPAEPDVQPACTEFVLDDAQVRQFLRDADGVDQRDYMHTLDWSPCHARGRIEFADGRAGIWTIRQFQTGSIAFDDGGEVFLFCPACNWKPFAW